MNDAPLRVLQSYRDPKPTTNPYITTLTEKLREAPDVEVMTFTFPRAIFGRYDVFHAHWPEVMMSGHKLISRIGRQLLCFAVLVRLSLTRTPVVRTVHNLELPTGMSRFSEFLLSWFDRLTKVRIGLNERTAAEVSGQTQTILHGDYRDRYAELSHAEMTPGLIQYFGLVRRYKGIEGLIGAFRDTDDPSLRLRISGSPSSADLADSLDALTDGDSRISTEWQFLDDETLAARVREAQLVVLPYRFMHNSGAVLTALSLGRPVLIPDNPVNQDLVAEVGASWVYTFRGDLSAQDLVSALARSAEIKGQPDLGRRDWADAAAAHVRVYRLALQGRSNKFRPPEM